MTFALAAAGAESAGLFRMNAIEIRRAALLIHAQLNLGLCFLGELSQLSALLRSAA